MTSTGSTSRFPWLFRASLVLLLVSAGIAGATAAWMRHSRARQLPGLKVSTSPPGCGVRLDGRYLGIAPVMVEDLSPGAHFVQAYREGYATRTVRVALNAGDDPRSLELSLDSLSLGSLEVLSTPLGATVVLDGENRGNTPIKIQGIYPGEHRLVLRRARYEPWSTTLRVASGKAAHVKASMEDSFLKFLNGAVEADPKNMTHRAEKFHYLMTREDWKNAGGSFFETLHVMTSQGVADPGKGGLWHWFARDSGLLAKDREGLFAGELGSRLGELAKTEKGGPAAAKIVRVMSARGRVRSRWMRNPAMLRRLCFAAARGAAGSRDVAEVALELATGQRQSDEVGKILAAAEKARPKDSKHIGWLAVKVVNLVKGGAVGGSFRGEALAAASAAVERSLTTEKDQMLRGRLYRLLAKIQLLQGGPKEALVDMNKAITALQAAGGKTTERLSTWHLERALVLVELKRFDEARAALVALSKRAPTTALKSRAAAELAKLKPDLPDK